MNRVTPDMMNQILASLEKRFGPVTPKPAPRVRPLIKCQTAQGSLANPSKEERELWLSDLKSDKFTDRQIYYASLSRKVL